MTAQALLNALRAGVTPALLRRYRHALGILSYRAVRDPDGGTDGWLLLGPDGTCVGELRPGGAGLLRLVPLRHP